MAAEGGRVTRVLRLAVAAVLAGCSGGGGGGGCTPGDPACSPPAVTATLSASASPPSAFVGQPYTVSGQLTAVSNGKADSVSIYTAQGARIAHATGAQVSTQLTPTVAGTFQYLVKGYASRPDNTGAISVSTTATAAVTNAPDITPPVVSITSPSQGQVFPAGTTTVPLAVTTDESATCRTSLGADSTYAQMQAVLTGAGTAHTLGVPVADGLSYSRYVRCIDGSGNANASGTQIHYSVATPAPIPLHVLLQGVSRAVLDVDGNGIDVPADTVLDVVPGAHTVGIKPGQALAYDFGEMTLGNAWYPLSVPNAQGTATLAYNVNIPSTATVVYDLLSRSTFTAAEKAAHDTLWVGSDGNYHPTKIVNWEVWALENPPAGVLSQLCSPMQPADLQGLIDAIPIMTAEDSAGGGPRRNFMYKSGDPIAAGKFTQDSVTGFWKPNPGVLLACRASPGGQSNDSWYDAQGFFSASWIRSSGDAQGWMSEAMDPIDLIFRGAEIGSNISRHFVAGGNIRMPLDDAAWSGPLRIAWKAGQNGYGLIKGIQ